MADNSPFLSQLASRARLLHSETNISQSQMAAAIGMRDGNYSLLLKYTNTPRQQAVATFSKPTRSSRIMELQENGKALRFDNSGWVPREGGTDDPNGTTDITSTTDAITSQLAGLVSVFKGLDYVTRKNVLDSFKKAHAAANSIPTTQKVHRKG
jgi:hypothetical protein